MNVVRHALAAVISIVLLGALQVSCSPATEEASTPDPEMRSDDLLVNRVWSRVDPAAAPGSLRVFLSDGVLLQDSCFETYRLSQWRRESPTRIAWNEDGIDIAAEVAQAADDALMLRIALQSEEVVESYVTALSPFVCPDFPK